MSKGEEASQQRFVCEGKKIEVILLSFLPLLLALFI